MRSTGNITVSGYNGLNVTGGSVAVIESTITTNNCTVAGINVESASQAYIQIHAGTGNNIAEQSIGGSILGVFSNASVSFTGLRYATSFGGRIYLGAQSNIPSY